MARIRPEPPSFPLFPSSLAASTTSYSYYECEYYYYFAAAAGAYYERVSTKAPKLSVPCSKPRIISQEMTR